MNCRERTADPVTLGPPTQASKQVEVAKSCGWKLVAACLMFVAIVVSAPHSFGSAAREKGVAGKTKAGHTDKMNKLDKALVLFTNKERAKADLPALKLSPALSFLARGQSKNMCDKRTLAHESDSFPPGWRRFSDRLKMAKLRAGAENVAYRTSSTDVEKWAREVVEGWMKSIAHRKNILNADFIYLGIGTANCADNYIYATQVFSPDSGTAP